MDQVRRDQNIYELICSEKQKVKVRRLLSIHLHIRSFIESLHGGGEGGSGERDRDSPLWGAYLPLLRGLGILCPADTEPFGVPRPFCSVRISSRNTFILQTEMAAKIQKNTLNSDPRKTNLGVEVRPCSFSGNSGPELQ